MGSRPRPTGDLPLVRGAGELKRSPAERRGSGVVGVIPAAGYGTRLGAAGSKEIQPIGGRPVIDFLVGRMEAAGAEEIRIVTRPEKTDLLAHADRLGLTIVAAHPDSLGESLAIGVDGLDPATVVLTGFPDSIWQPPDGFHALLERLEAGFEIALGLFRTADAEPPHLAELGPAGTVSGVQIRPGARGPHLIWGAVATRARELAAPAGRHPSTVFDERARAGVVAGVHLSDEYIDIGTPAGIEAARSRFG